MTLGAFWTQYHTQISIILGPVLAIIIFRWLKTGWLLKCIILAAATLVLVGMLGFAINIVLAFLLAGAYYVGWVVIWIGGLVMFGVFKIFNFADYAWWQKILFGGVWFWFSIFIDVGLRFLVAFVQRKNIQEGT